MPKIVSRAYSPEAARALTRAGCHPVLARVYAARAIHGPEQLGARLASLHPFHSLYRVQDMAQRLAEAIAKGSRILILADYDADGATACAVGIRALRSFGAAVDYLVPNRFEYGYGLTPEIVRLAFEVKRPDVLITVDNGIGAVEGVEEARRLGISVLITDHHLPGPVLPNADCIVNPNQPGCGFPSKNLAGVGVLFYVMLALRAELRSRGAFAGRQEPNLGDLLPLVALGTVADVVPLDDNNRILVGCGLARIRAGVAQPGIHALLEIAGRDPRRVSSYDLGFVLGPRLNAAGRLADMGLGIECLITDDEARARALAQSLDRLNWERREIERDQLSAISDQLSRISGQFAADSHPPPAISLFDPSFHPGVIGILASRIKDRFHRPTLVFAKGHQEEIKGSGRSIPALHLRDALDRVAKRHPGLLLKFGGHAGAAGLTLRAADFERFRQAFQETVEELLTPADLEQVIETDGSLEVSEMNLALARQLSDNVWGQGFPEPCFEGAFRVESQRVVGERHLKLVLETGGTAFEAMLFSPAQAFGGTAGRQPEPLPDAIYAVYRLEVNEYNGTQKLQLLLRHWEKTEPS